MASQQVGTGITRQASPEAPAPGAAVPAPGSAKVAVRFITQDKDTDLMAACDAVLAGMAGNPDYPAPVPTLARLGTARDVFVAAMEANDGGTRAVAARDQARDALEPLLRELAAYVQHACKGDRVRLLASGFPVQRQRSKGQDGPLPRPTGLKVRRGHLTGQAIVRCTAVPATRLYEWRHASAQDPLVWTQDGTTSRVVCILQGLVQGTRYRAQVRALGKHGGGDWSESVSFTAT